MSAEPKKQDPFVIPPDEATKHYIRTFESDSAAVKQGTRPGFAAIDEAASAVSTPLTPADVSAKAAANDLFEIGAAEPAEPAKPAEPVEPARARIIEGSVLPTFTHPKPEVPPKPAPPPAPAPVEKAPLRTYTSDFAEHLKETGASTATVLAAEGDAGAKSSQTTSTFNIPLIAGGLVLIILGAGGAYATYRYVSAPQPIQIATTVSTPIFVNEREEIHGVGGELRDTIVASLAKPLAEGSVRLLYTSAATSTGNDIFRALQLPAPGILLRNVTAENSMAGIVNVNGTATPFFILQVSSYGETFAGMLAWESRLNSDLGPLFAPSATTTTVFRDEIISNHDIRVLRDADKQSIVLYGYWDPSILLIARNESAYAELLKRLTTSRTQQ